MRYDLADERFTSKSAGVAFDCDCMSARLTYSEGDTTDVNDETDRTLKLSVELRTIGQTSFSAGL